jgi:osmotically-inducible protein OsmY
MRAGGLCTSVSKGGDMPLKSSTIDAVAENEVRGRVRQFLDSHHFASFRELTVTVSGDSVILHGCVHTFHERELAVALSGHVAGVHHVLDQLVVSDPSRQDQSRESFSPPVSSAADIRH